MKEIIRKIEDTMDIWAPVVVWIFAMMINIACAYCMAHGIEPAHMDLWPEWLGNQYYLSVVMCNLLMVLERVFKPFKEEET